MAQDLHQQALERYKNAQEYMRENHERMREDLRFSNPADPQQWDKKAVALRVGRPCLTFWSASCFSWLLLRRRQRKSLLHRLPRL